MYLLRRLSRILLAITLMAFFVFLFLNRSGIDSRGPVIHTDVSLLEVSVNDGEDVLLEGVTARDSSDGDVTASVEVENISTFYSDKKRLVTYVAFDSDNHVVRATRELKYTDYESPRFVLSEPLQYLPGAVNLKVSAVDCLDGDITSAIKLVAEDTITTDQPGKYRASFQVANSAGDVSSLPVVIEIQERVQGAPRILLTTYLDYVSTGSAFDPYSYLAYAVIGSRQYRVERGEGNYNKEGIGKDEEIVVGSDSISVANGVDTSKPGTYQVEYSITADMGINERVTTHTLLYVVVR